MIEQQKTECRSQETEDRSQVKEDSTYRRLLQRPAQISTDSEF